MEVQNLRISKEVTTSATLPTRKEAAAERFGVKKGRRDEQEGATTMSHLRKVFRDNGQPQSASSLHTHTHMHTITI